MRLQPITSQMFRKRTEHNDFLVLGHKSHDLRQNQSESVGNNWNHIALSWKRWKYDRNQTLIKFVMTRWFKVVKCENLCLRHGFIRKQLPQDCLTTTPRLPHDHSSDPQRLPHDYSTTTPRPPWTQFFRVLQVLSLGTQKYAKTMFVTLFGWACSILCMVQAISVNIYLKSIIS